MHRNFDKISICAHALERAPTSKQKFSLKFLIDFFDVRNIYASLRKKKDVCVFGKHMCT